MPGVSVCSDNSGAQNALRLFFRRASVLLFLCLIPACARKDDVVSLTGEWEYRSGFQESWLNDSTGEWKKVRLPEHFNRLPEFQNDQGTITLRHRIPEKLAQRIGQGRPVAFASGQISDTSRLYFNSQLVAQLGSEEDYRSGHNLQFVQTLPQNAYRPVGENEIFVVVRSIGNYRFWMKGPVIEIGPAEEIFQSLNVRIVSMMFIISGILMIGFYHLLLLARRRQDIYNLFFGVFSTSIALWILMNSDIAHLLSADTVLLRRRIDQISLMFVGPFFLMFLESYSGRKFSRIGLVWTALCMLIAITDTFAPFRIMIKALQIWMGSMIAGGALIVFTILREVFRKNRDAYFMAGGVLLLIGGSVVDMLIDRGILKGSFISQYSIILFDAGIATVLANRYARVQKQIEDLNQDLENKVTVRTQELQESLTTVQNLKQQQDGDYFLTSQLIAPLSRIHASSVELHISAVVKQKKVFRYRKWAAELGGDLAISHEINLRGSAYTVVMNADAMGKSMQGAGGALVLGSAVKSIITRTNSAPELRRDSPEQWLRRCYLDLQALFISFDGTMIISLILGLIDRENGSFLWINAEHPRPVLYRNGKAEFFRKEHVLRKIGVDDDRIPFAINAAQLDPGDVVFLGSDGRDDIRFVEEDGRRTMNEDESFFLNLSTRSEGNLEKLIDLIEASGEITDDLTLIRIGYREDEPARLVDAAREEEFDRLCAEASSFFNDGLLDHARQSLEEAKSIRSSDRRFLEMLLAVCRKQKDFAAAEEAVEKFLIAHPASNSLLYTAAVIKCRTGKLEEAVDLAERCRMRDPLNVKNLVFLADLYRRLENIDRAETLLEQARKMEGASIYVTALEEKLKKNRSAA